MEELRSTEILDKEIKADARKKAEKILAKADADCKNMLENVDARIENAKKEYLAKTEEKLRFFEKDLAASLPLEKKRFLVSFIQSSINKATDAFLQSLSVEEKLELIMRQIQKYENCLKSKKLVVSYYGFEEKLLKKAFENKYTIVSFNKTDFNKLIIESDCGITTKLGIILEADDKSVRVRTTLSEIICQLQDEYRTELCKTLFDGRLE